MALLSEELGGSVVPAIILTLILSLEGLNKLFVVLSYFYKKKKWDQLTLIYLSICITSFVMSLTLLLHFIFLLGQGLYFELEDESVRCKGGVVAFITHNFFIITLRVSVFYNTLLVLLTTVKTRWPVFKTTTRALKIILAAYPACLLVLLLVHVIVDDKESCKFYLPWVSESDVMTFLYFWLPLVLPTIVSLCAVVWLSKVICTKSLTIHLAEFDAGRSDEDCKGEGSVEEWSVEEVDGESRVIDLSPIRESDTPPVNTKFPNVRVEHPHLKNYVRNEEEAEGGKAKLVKGLQHVGTHLSEKMNKTSRKIPIEIEVRKPSVSWSTDWSTVKIRTITTVVMLAMVTIVTTLVSTCAVFSVLYTQGKDYVLVYYLGVLLPAFKMIVVDTVILVYRVRGLRLYVVKIYVEAWGAVVGKVKEKMTERETYDQ